MAQDHGEGVNDLQVRRSQRFGALRPLQSFLRFDVDPGQLGSEKINRGGCFLLVRQGVQSRTGGFGFTEGALAGRDAPKCHRVIRTALEASLNMLERVLVIATISNGVVPW